MKYDFDKVVERRNSNSLKWDVAENELPMWVADMDFATCPAVKEAIFAKAQSGVFGYQIVPEEWYAAIGAWWQRRHGFAIDKEWLCFCTGVIPAVTSCVKRLTSVGDSVVIQTPVYDIFFHSVENTGRHVLENQLQYDRGRGYFIDFADLEQKLADPLTTMMILCNPHNPVGKIWTREELQKIGALCKKYGVVVLSDEIHCDLTDPDENYTPFAAASEEGRENSVTCISASKAFNLAGLQSAAVVVPNELLRHKVVRALNSDEVAEPNAFAVETTVAAFTKGEEWLEELRAYLLENKNIVKEFLQKNLPKLHLVEQKATYLLWLDCGEITSDGAALCAFVREKTGLYITGGNQYRGNGKTFVRMNVACPKSVLLEGLKRLKTGVEEWINSGMGGSFTI
jgi:cystathionine beta-lyase